MAEVLIANSRPKKKKESDQQQQSQGGVPIKNITLCDAKTGFVILEHIYQWPEQAVTTNLGSLILSFYQFAREVDDGDIVSVNFEKLSKQRNRTGTLTVSPPSSSSSCSPPCALHSHEVESQPPGHDEDGVQEEPSLCGVALLRHEGPEHRLPRGL